MRKVTSVVLLAVLGLTATLGTATMQAQSMPATYEGESYFHNLPGSVVFGAGYKKSTDMILQLRAIEQSWKDLGLLTDDEMKSFVDMMEKVNQFTVLVAVNDMNRVDFDTFINNDPGNFCLMGRMQMDAALEQEMLAGKPDNVLLARMGGYTYLTSEGCLTHRDFNTQNKQMMALDALNNSDHNVYMYINKEQLQKRFMQSRMYTEMLGQFSPSMLMYTMGLNSDDEMLNKKREMMMKKLLDTLASMHAIEMLMDSKRMYSGVGYQNGTLTFESDVEYSSPYLASLTSELYDASARTSKVFLTDDVRMQINTNVEGYTSMNMMSLSNMDASVFFAAGGNSLMMLMLMGGMEAMMPMHGDMDMDMDMDMDAGTMEQFPLEEATPVMQ